MPTQIETLTKQLAESEEARKRAETDLETERTSRADETVYFRAILNDPYKLAKQLVVAWIVEEADFDNELMLALRIFIDRAIAQMDEGKDVDFVPTLIPEGYFIHLKGNDFSMSFTYRNPEGNGLTFELGGIPEPTQTRLVRKN